MTIAVRFATLLLPMATLGLAAPALGQTASPPPAAPPATAAASRAAAAAADVQAPVQSGFTFKLLGQTVRLGGTAVPPPYQGTAYTTFAGQPESGVDNVMAQQTGQR